MTFIGAIHEARGKIYKLVDKSETTRKRNYDFQHLRASLLTFLVKKILKRAITFKDRNGFKLTILPDESLFSLYSFFYLGYLGYPEIGEQEYCKNNIGPGMTVFDVGANIGQFTLLFSSLVGKSGKIVSFEPCSNTLQRLRSHIAINRIDNIVTEKMAAHDHHGGEIRLNVYPEVYSAWNTMGNPTMRDREGREVQPIGSETVPTITIDEYCLHNGISMIDHLKVDVEGAELYVLKGCSELLKRKAVHRLQFEYSKDMILGVGLDGTEVFTFLKDYGYTCHPISPKGSLLPSVMRSDVDFGNFIAMYES